VVIVVVSENVASVAGKAVAKRRNPAVTFFIFMNGADKITEQPVF